MTPEERQELLAGYVLGTLAREEQDAVEELVRRDASAAAELASLHEIVDLVALDVPLRHADPALRGRVLGAARREQRPVPLHRRLASRWIPSLPTVAAAAVAVVAVLWGMDMRGDLEQLREETSSLTAVVQADAKRIEALTVARGQAAEADALRFELRDGETRQRDMLAAITLDEQAWEGELAPTAAGHGASGRYMWSTSIDAGALIVQDLPPLPLGMVYQVWLDDGVMAMPGATFVPNDSGDATVLIEPEDTVQPLFISVSVAPAGGSRTIEQPVVLSGIVDRQ